MVFDYHPHMPESSPQARTRPLKRVRIITKTGHEHAAALGEEISLWLTTHGVAVSVAEHQRPTVSVSGVRTDEQVLLGPDTVDGQRPLPDLCLVLGGDGTLLSVAHEAVLAGVPLLGVNLGTLGFLAKTTPADWQPILRHALENGIAVEERMTISSQVCRQGKDVWRAMAVNDVVVSRGAMARLIRMDLAYGEDKVMDIRADGLIIATPTGSTAYAVSAGGPAIHPHMAAFGVTTICPFPGVMLRALVLPADQPLHVGILETQGEVYLTEDGQHLFRLMPGDEVIVRRSPHDLQLMAVDDAGYFSVLRQKGFVRG